jgi:putative oxidoreductase
MTERSSTAPYTFLHNPRLGYHLLRISVAVLMLFHGVAKITGGVDGIKGMLGGAGLPQALAYGVYVGEVIAPLLILIGLWVGPAALIMAVNMLFAIFLAHSGDIFQVTGTGAWAIELQMLFLIGSLVIALQAPPFGHKG